jgi:uncharacterized membrane protein
VTPQDGVASAFCAGVFNVCSRICITAADVMMATASKNSALLIFFMVKLPVSSSLALAFRFRCVRSVYAPVAPFWAGLLEQHPCH